MKRNEFTCSSCGKTFEKGWSDAEAKKEYDDNFPEFKEAPRAVVCDICFKRIMKSNQPPERSLIELNPSFQKAGRKNETDGLKGKGEKKWGDE